MAAQSKKIISINGATSCKTLIGRLGYLSFIALPLLVLNGCTAPLGGSNIPVTGGVYPHPQARPLPPIANAPLPSVQPRRQQPSAVVDNTFDPYRLKSFKAEPVMPLPASRYPVPAPVRQAPVAQPQSEYVRQTEARQTLEGAFAQKQVQPQAIQVAQAPVQQRPQIQAEPERVVKDTANDPYQRIPDAKPEKSTASSGKASPAVMALIIKAKADSNKGRTDVAISRLERALRIDADNPTVWSTLAKLYYQKGDYNQAIVMGQKANLYTENGSALANENWKLIKQAASKSGNVKALREALQYQSSR